MNDLMEIVLIALACPLALPIVIEKQEDEKQEDKEIDNDK